MLLTLTAKIKILPSPSEQTLLYDTMQAYSSACNYVSEYIFTSKELGQYALNKVLYYNIRSRFSLRSQVAQSVIKTVISRYKSIQSNGDEWTKPTFKRLEYDLVWNRDYLLRGDVFSVSTLSGRIKVAYNSEAMQHYFDGTWHFGTAKLVFKHNKWFLHIPMSKEIDILQDEDVVNVVGVDLGINFTATSYDSLGNTVFYAGRTIKRRRAQFSKNRKDLQQRKTPSSRSRLKRIGSRENRWVQDINHQVSKSLVESQPAKTLFVLEDLTGIRAATERVVLKNRYVTVSWAFYDLRQKLEYKALRAGSKVVAVNPKYTSQTCPKCGHTKQTNRNKKAHVFCCKNCGYTSNDDRVGAMNLHRKGIEYLSAVASE